MNEPSVDIIICAYNNEKIIWDCLEHVKSLKYENKTCIVVDDASTDGTVKVVEQNYPWATVIEKKEQSGPSTSRNLAIKRSKNEYILFLDSDVLVKPDFLSNLMEAINKNPKTAICGAKLILPNGTIDSVGGGITRVGIGFDIGHGKPEENYTEGAKVMYVPSAAMLVKREVVNKIGCFDETYFYGHEDTDLCWRANIAGYEVYYEPSAVAVHYKNQTVKTMTKEVYYYGIRNRLRSLFKNHQPLTLILFYPIFKIYLTFCIFTIPYRGEPIKAWWWNIKNIKDTLMERKKVQELRVVSDFKLPFSGMRNLFVKNG